MCSTETPFWSATEATQSFSHLEERKLGVTIEKREVLTAYSNTPEREVWVDHCTNDMIVAPRWLR